MSRDEGLGSRGQETMADGQEKGIKEQWTGDWNQENRDRNQGAYGYRRPGQETGNTGERSYWRQRPRDKRQETGDRRQETRIRATP